MDKLRKTAGFLLIGVALVILTLKLTHRYNLAPQIEKLGVKAGAGATNVVKRVGADTLVYVILVGLPFCFGVLMLIPAAPKPEQEPSHTPQSTHPRATKSKGGKTVQACNVLKVGPESRQLWQFDARNGGFVLSREQVSLTGEALPSGIRKDWRALFQRKLNVAWLPPENVFLRVIQLPHSEFSETLAMVELQLEKLSPQPVAQIVWTIQTMPHSAGNMQTVIVIIVSRDVVEEFLGQLEGQGYLADSLELPLLDQLHATPIGEDGVWIYPEALGGKNVGLAAWWYGGVLQNLDLLTLTATTDRSDRVREQLTQMAWAGEMEGWLTAPPRWHLVATPPLASEWEPALKTGLDQPVEVLEPLPAPQLAAATARRVAHSPNTGLLPQEFSLRYHQQFVDRLWMRGLLGIFVLYAVGVAIYLVALNVASYRTDAVEARMKAMGPTYTNAMQMQAMYEVLKDREELKFAALECWKKVAENMPETVTLDGWNFADGRRLNLNGTAAGDQVQQLLDFEAAMRRSTGKDGEPMFDWQKAESLTYRNVNGVLNWNFSLELKRTEPQ